MDIKISFFNESLSHIECRFSYSFRSLNQIKTSVMTFSIVQKFIWTNWKWEKLQIKLSIYCSLLLWSRMSLGHSQRFVLSSPNKSQLECKRPVVMVEHSHHHSLQYLVLPTDYRYWMSLVDHQNPPDMYLRKEEKMLIVCEHFKCLIKIFLLIV